MSNKQGSIDQSIGGDTTAGEGGAASTSAGPGSPVFKPDTSRDAKGTGSHQSGEGGSGNESGPQDAPPADVPGRAPMHPS